MYCRHCQSKLHTNDPTMPLATVLTKVDSSRYKPAQPAPSQSKKDTLTRMSAIACSLLLLILALAFFFLSTTASSLHQVMLMGLGLLLLSACEVVWTARTRKAVIGSFVVAGAGVALVGVLFLMIGAWM